MKKAFLAVILVVLIVCNVFMLMVMRNGYDLSSLSLFDSNTSSVDVSSEQPEVSSVMPEPLEVSPSEQAEDVSADEDTLVEDTDKLNVSLVSVGKLTDYSSVKTGEDIGNYAANIYNGGNIVKYKKKFYYTDMNNSNYLYFSRSDFSLYSKLNKVYATNINVCDEKIYYIDNADMTIYSVKMSSENHKKLNDNRAACLIAAGDYLYYVLPKDEKSQCGELHRMEKNGKNDVKISPDGYMCENIIPCGNYILFVNVGADCRSICVLDVKKSEVTELYSGNVSDINYCGGVLWFVRHLDESDEICKVESGSDEIRVLAQSAKIKNLIASGEYIYYIAGEGENSQCCRISSDGTKSDIIYSNQKACIESFNVVDGCIYFSVSGSEKMRCVTPGDSAVTIMPGLKKDK